MSLGASRTSAAAQGFVKLSAFLRRVRLLFTKPVVFSPNMRKEHLASPLIIELCQPRSQPSGDQLAVHKTDLLRRYRTRATQQAVLCCFRNFIRVGRFVGVSEGAFISPGPGGRPSIVRKTDQLVVNLLGLRCNDEQLLQTREAPLEHLHDRLHVCQLSAHGVDSIRQGVHDVF